MWPFKKVKSLADAGIMQGFTDWHSHILPGVDDGVKTMDDALEILGKYESLGVRKIWLTPHIMEDYPNGTEELRTRFAELKERWKGGIELRLAAENMLDSLFEERLETRDFLPIGDEGRHLLVETSYYNPPMGMDDMLDRIKGAGYFPVLAHPERYRYMEEKEYRALKEAGVLFQINFISLTGGYGEAARKKAEWLLAQGYADVAGSDIHRLSSTMDFIGRAPGKSSVLNSLLRVSRNGL